MAIQTTNRSQLTAIAETTWGTTPGVGSMQIFRYTGESFDNTYSFTESGEIVSDRMTTDMVRVQAGSSGAVNFELSYGATGLFEIMVEGALMSTWTINVLKTGTTPKSFTIEKQFLDVTQFLAFPGCRVNTMSLAFKTGAIVTGSFGFIGKQSLPMAVTTVRATTAAVSTGSVLAPVDSIQLLQEGGVAVGIMTDLSINLTNSLRPLNIINSPDPFDVNAGRQRVTGSFTIYFQDAALFAKFRALTTTSLLVQIGGATTLRYDILVPKIKITKAAIVAGGGDQDMMVQCDYTSIKDAGTSSVLQITRNP